MIHIERAARIHAFRAGSPPALLKSAQMLSDRNANVLYLLKSVRPAGYIWLHAEPDRIHFSGSTDLEFFDLVASGWIFGTCIEDPEPEDEVNKYVGESFEPFTEFLDDDGDLNTTGWPDCDDREVACSEQDPAAAWVDTLHGICQITPLWEPEDLVVIPNVPGLAGLCTAPAGSPVAWDGRLEIVNGIGIMEDLTWRLPDGEKPSADFDCNIIQGIMIEIPPEEET